MTDNDTDPLDGADVGETETVSKTRELWLGDIASDAVRGSDRFADHRLADATLVTDEHGEKHLSVTVESDVTKRLPRQWDRARERDTANASTVQRPWWPVVTHAVALALPVVVGSAVTARLMSEMEGETMVQAGTAPTFAELFMPTALVVVLLLLLINRGMKGALPRPTGGDGR